MPSPEQGTSVRMQSNSCSSSVNSEGSLLVTTTSGCPHLVRFSANICTRLRITSLATSRLPSGNRLRRWVDLPPGAAQRSSTASGLSGKQAFTACSTNMDEASCT